jgi:8-amino-7-oxononanoate synthase
MLTERMKTDLHLLELNGKLRNLSPDNTGIDFCSNDYLGLAKRDTEVVIAKAGSTGSRLISGNYGLLESFEKSFADFLDVESTLFFANGYLANLGLFSCIAKKQDTIIYDQYVHASIRDGISMSAARNFSFKHNSLDDLARKLALSSGEIFVVVESVYSMDGDSPDLTELSQLCRHHKAHLIVDEAHGMGANGDTGKGLCHTLGISDCVFARIFPLGKAFGMEGALVAGSTNLSNYLINFSRPFIFTTGPSPFKIKVLEHQFSLYKQVDFSDETVTRLKKQAIDSLSNLFPIKSGEFGNIIMLKIPGNEQVMRLAQYLQENGLNVKGIRSPTVPAGEEGLRICLHNYNTTAEISLLCQQLHTYYQTI